MSKASDNENFARAAQAWLGVPVDGWAGIKTMAAFIEKTGQNGMRRKASQKAIDLIHSFEQLRLDAYKDPGSSNGLPITIGWGSTSDLAGQPIQIGDRWTKEQADKKFEQDLAKFDARVAKLAPNATQGQHDALVSFDYNTGSLHSSTLLKKHNAGDYAGAKAEFARWVYNDGKKMNGLVRRRQAEAEMYGS